MEHTHTHKAYEPKVEHTNKRYEDELSALSAKLTQMGELVVAQLENALRSFAEHDIHWFVDWPWYAEKSLGPDPAQHGWQPRGRQANFILYHRDGSP